MVESFVAINVYIKSDNKKELATNGVPLLFWCNDMELFYQDLLNDINFRKLIENTCLNTTSYTSSYIAYFHFNNEEEYEDTTISVQELFSIDKLSDIEKFFTKEYLNAIFINLYEISMKTHYENNLMFDINATIIDIYQKLQQRFKDKIVKSTIINYVRSELNKKELTQNNIDLIIDELEIILKDET